MARRNRYVVRIEYADGTPGVSFQPTIAAATEVAQSPTHGERAIRSAEVLERLTTGAEVPLGRRYYAIPPERPERLKGPEVGALVLIQSRYDWLGGRVGRVLERSYVWAPGDPAYHGGSRRYDWKVVEYGPGKRLVLDDDQLTVLEVGQRMAPIDDVIDEREARLNRIAEVYPEAAAEARKA